MYTRFRQTSLLFIMRDFIVLKKTKKYHSWLKQVPSSCDIYKVMTIDKSAIRRFRGEDKKNIIMLAGGPRLVEGELLPNNEEYRIIQISYLQGNYYLILKEENNGESNISSDQSTENI